MDQAADKEALAAAARESEALRQALTLAEWVGVGRPVTAKQRLRRADVKLLGRELGIEVPRGLSTAADLPALRYPWMAALGSGLLSISDGQVVAAPELAGWRSATDGEVLDAWARGLAAALVETYEGGDEWEALEIGRLVLTVLTADSAPTGVGLLRTIGHAVHAADPGLYGIFNGGAGRRDPAKVALQIMAAFGAAAGENGRWRITPLGRWVVPILGSRVPSLLGSAGAAADPSGICQVRITLRYVRPACWRRLLVPASASLGDLHEIIQIAFAWDNDHLHKFEVGQRRYADPRFDAEHNERKIKLGDAFGQADGPIIYTYGFGDAWSHEIVLEKIIEPKSSATYPTCVAGRGDAPVEDWEGDEAAWIPFDRAGINLKLVFLR